MAEQVPLVNYLVLGEDPHLVAQECTSCGAKFFDRRNACASCSATEFKPFDVPTSGELKAFTIVSMAAPGVPVPFVAGIIDCDGTPVRGNVINTEPDPDHVTLGMKVKLATFVVGTDENGTEAVGFGFEPIDSTKAEASNG
ncbi:MAG: OB-fold domain-containing protein [Acidimicrobiia bacterium]|nr:OB-fold domain-containing protein [Acidimicrobiia bacterium]